MAIKFKCSSCQTELTVKDELAGKQGKCPKCKAVLIVPAPTASKPAGARSPSRPAPVQEEVIAGEIVEDDDEVVEGTVEDDDVADAVFEDDEDEPRKGKGKGKQTSADDFDVESAGGKGKSKSKSRRRDEEEDDEDEEDEDDRPRKKKGAKAKKRRDDYDDDEDEDDEDDDRPKLSPKKRRARFKKASLGVFLNSISSFVYAGALVVSLICVIIFTAAMSSRSGGGEGLGTFLKILSWLVMLGLVGALVTSVVGNSFTILTPARYGAMGLAIATVATSGVSLLLVIVAVINMIDNPFGVISGYRLGGMTLNPLAGIRSQGFGFAYDLGVVAYLLPLTEVGRLTCFAFYQWAVCRSEKDRGGAKSAMILGIVVPSVCLGVGLIFWILQTAIKNWSTGGFIVVQVIYYLLFSGLMGYYAFASMNARSTLQDAR